MEVGSIEYIATINTSNYKSGAKDIQKANRDMEGSTNSAEQSTNKFSTSLQRFASRGVKVAAVGMAALATTIATMTIKGGISRALNIEDAQAKLRGLGHDAASVETIMESALASVKGTAYGLDAAATAAASAVAAGVKPGQELTKYLSLAGDAATIAGVSFEEMSSIFGKVQTQQRAYTMEINQLADRGIPIYQWLQEELGVTQEALRKMVAAGEVDSATYFKVIQKNIGGAALESGKTTRGAWQNLLAAMSRVGERIVKGPIDSVREGFGTMTKWIDNNSDTIVYAVQDTLDVMVALGRGVVATGKFLWDMRAVIVGLVTAWATYRTILIAINVVKALNAALTTAQVVALKAQTAAIMLSRGATVSQTVAMLGLNAAMLANPIALVTAAVVGLIAVVATLASSTNRMTAEERYLNDTKTKSIEISNRVRDAENALKDSRNEAARADLALERAERNLAQAVKNYGEKSLEAREAQLDLDDAKARAEKANNSLKENTQELTEAQRQQRDMIEGIIQKLDTLNGKNIRYTMNGTNMVASKQSDGKNYLMPEFATGGYTGAGGKHEPMGVVHGGEYVLRKDQVDQTTGRPRLSALADMMGDAVGGGGGIVNNIQNVTISSEVDGERWLRRLSGNQEIVSNGLVPTQSYM